MERNTYEVGQGGVTPRVAILTPFANRAVGGVEVFNESLQRALGRIEIFAPDRRPARGPWGDLRRMGLQQPMEAMRAARDLLRRHREDPFDVILSNGLYGWPLTLARPGVPLIQVYHNTMAGFARRALPARGDRFTTAHVMGLFDRIAGVGKHVVVVSRPLQREVEVLYGFKARLIPNAVDTDVFRPADPASAREELGIPEDVGVGLFVGRPNHTKGYDILLKVASRMPETTFLVAGGRPDERANVRCLGRVDHEEMPKLYAASDFFFLPSRYEGFSLSLLEAMACGLPVVVSEAAWPFSEEAESCGVVVAGDREEDFVGAIRFVLSKKDSLSPREFVSLRNSFAVFCERWRDLIRSLVGRGG